MIRLMKYAGAKNDFITIINEHINQSSKSIYVEPFLGSGAVFFNLEKHFDRYILNDLDTNVIRIFKSFKEGTYEELQQYISFVNTTYGDIKRSKESFYLFRNEFNRLLWKTDTLNEGFGLWLLFNSCINSIARFGPNGFNSCFGNRSMTKDFNEIMFQKINARLQRAELYNTDFFNLMTNIDLDKALLFLDPPYIKRPVGYKTISPEFYNNYIEFCKTTNANILYTDIEHDDLDMTKIVLREKMQNIAPARKEEFTVLEQQIIKEVMYKNY